MSVLFITLKSNVRRLFSETREKKCFLAGSELQGRVTNLPFPVPLLLYTHGNADMDIFTCLLKVDQSLVCCLEMCGTGINHRAEQGKNMCCCLAAWAGSGLHNWARQGSGRDRWMQIKPCGFERRFKGCLGSTMLTASSGERVQEERNLVSLVLMATRFKRGSSLEGLYGSGGGEDTEKQLGQPSASCNHLKVSQDISSKQPSKVNPDFKESTRLKKIMELFCFLHVG